MGRLSIDDLARTLDMAADTLENVAASQPASFSWNALVQGNAQPAGLRRLIAVLPVLVTSELEPGRRATDAIRLDLKGFDESVKAFRLLPSTRS